MNVVFDLGAVLLSWEPVALVRTQLSPHAPTAEAAHALARQMFHHEDWLGFDRGTHSLDDAIGRMALRLALPADRLSEVLAPMGERLEPIAVTVELLATRYRLPAAQTVFIDDALANVLAAREFGWQAIHCERPSALPAQLAAYLPVSSTLSTSKPSVRA